MANQIIDSLQFNGPSGDKNILSLPCCTCDTAANVAAKTVTLNNFVLEPGVQILVKFVYTNTAFYPSLNVNNTGAKNIRINNTNIPGSSLVSSNVYLFLYDGSAWNIVSGAVKKQCIVGQVDNQTTSLAKPWYKVAYIKVEGAHYDRSITFKVNQVYGGASANTGILTAHVRTNNSRVFESGELKWEYANSGVTPDNFVLVHKSTANTCLEAEIWAKQPSGHTQYLFDVMFEGTRDAFGDYWTLYNQQTAGGQASLPSGWTQIVSTLTTIKNKTDTAGYATSAGSATNIPQNTSTNNAYRSLLMRGYTQADNKPSGTPGQTYYNDSICARTDTGELKANKLVLTSIADAAGKTAAEPALIVGGTSTTAHMQMDANEIIAKTNGTTPGPLYLNGEGGDVYVGSSATTETNLHVPNGAVITPTVESSGDLCFDRGTGGTASSCIFKNNGVENARFASGGHFCPGANQTYNLGSSALSWKNGYFSGRVYTSAYSSASGGLTAPQFRNIAVVDSTPTDLSNYTIGDIILVLE